MHIAVSNETILLVIKFRIGGSLRFLSHAETVKVFQRAFVRIGLQIRHSKGFNPRPKLSLPFPRPVGVESDQELLCVQINNNAMTQHNINTGEFCTSVKARLSGQLPEGLELISVDVIETKKSFQPSSATCIFKIKPEYLHDRLQARIKDLLASEKLISERRINKKLSKFQIRNSKFKQVDVRPFLKSVQLIDDCIVVRCQVSSAGSIRVDEILKLLELDVWMLSAPVKRTNLQWIEA